MTRPEEMEPDRCTILCTLPDGHVGPCRTVDDSASRCPRCESLLPEHADGHETPCHCDDARRFRLLSFARSEPEADYWNVDGECDLWEFIAANLDALDPDLISNVRALTVGDSLRIGGGAAPLMKVERIS